MKIELDKDILFAELWVEEFIDIQLIHVYKIWMKVLAQINKKQYKDIENVLDIVNSALLKTKE